MGITVCLFDLDGVLTQTAKVHAAAWAEMFDDYLRTRADRGGEPFAPFTPQDYNRYVDGLATFAPPERSDYLPMAERIVASGYVHQE